MSHPGSIARDQVVLITGGTRGIGLATAEVFAGTTLTTDGTLGFASKVPFGGGAHACLGLSFARLQALLVLHHVCREARWTLPAWHPRRVHWLPVPRPSFDLPLRFS